MTRQRRHFSAEQKVARAGRGAGAADAGVRLRLLDRAAEVDRAVEAKIADLKVLAEQLTRLPAVTIEANATEEGHLYGSIGPLEISKTLKGKNLKVEPEMVKLETPIKEANTLTEVPLSLGYGIEAKIQVLVVALQGAPKK